MNEMKINLDLTEKMPDRKILAFDIETYKWKEHSLIVEGGVEKIKESYKTPKVIEEHTESYLGKLALSPMTGQVIMCGFWDGENYVSFTTEDNTEEELVIKTLEYIGNAHFEGYRLLSKGGKRFDLPYLLMRGMILGVKPKFNVQWDRLVHKYRHWDHIDLESFFEQNTGLYKVAYACDLSSVINNPGNEIAALYESGQIELIKEKNLEDLKLTYQLYERLKWANL